MTENTGKILFDDDSDPQWYLATAGNRWIGPLTASDVYRRVKSGEISWAHFVWKKGQAEWKRLCDVRAFQAVVPGAPAKDMQKEVKKQSTSPTPPPAITKSLPRIDPARTGWFLYYEKTQYGPFSAEEVERLLAIGKIDKRVHAWHEGMAGWARLERIPAFNPPTKLKPPGRPGSGLTEIFKGDVGEMRNAPRRPLVARLLMTNRDKQDRVIVGMCRDISIGGMQVLTDRVPGVTGSRVKLNVSPPPSKAKGKKGDTDKTTLKPFVAEGKIVRILEDGRGFSFRFERLAKDARDAIEQYINAEK